MPSRKSHFIRLAVVAALLIGARVHADSPPRPPADKTVCSQNGIFCAKMDAGAAETRIVTGQQILWRLPGWHRDAYLADDGEHLVTGYDGLSLLQQDYTPDTVMLTFWRQGRMIREVTLSETILQPSNLKPTVSHYLWGRSVGFDDGGRFVIHTVENRRIAFDVETGTAVDIRREAYPGN